MRLIDADAAIDMLKKTIAVNKNPNHDARVWEEGMNCALTIIGAEPSVEAAPVVHGRWIEHEEYNFDTYYDCSVCGESWCTVDGTPWENGMNYCPNCGAKMDGGEDERHA